MAEKKTTKKKVAKDVRQRPTTITNYQQQAAVTSATSDGADEAMLMRVSEVANMLFYLFGQFAKVAQNIDVMKRHIFYGKPCGADWLDAIKQDMPPMHKLDIQQTLRFDKYVRHIHGATGIVTEAGELVESVLAIVSTGKLDAVNFVEELGDLEWYIAECANAIDKPMLQILVDNIAKLKERYSEKFNIEEAVDRDLEAEREALEVSDKESPDPFESGGPLV